MKRTAVSLAVSLMLAGCGGGTGPDTDTAQGVLPIAPISLPLAPASQPTQARR